MFVVYQGLGEVFVTTPENEAEFLIEYGTKCGRNFEDYYDRDEVDTLAIDITSSIKVDW